MFIILNFFIIILKNKVPNLTITVENVTSSSIFMKKNNWKRYLELDFQLETLPLVAFSTEKTTRYSISG